MNYFFTRQYGANGKPQGGRPSSGKTVTAVLTQTFNVYGKSKGEAIITIFGGTEGGAQPARELAKSLNYAVEQFHKGGTTTTTANNRPRSKRKVLK